MLYRKRYDMAILRYYITPWTLPTLPEGNYDFTPHYYVITYQNICALSRFIILKRIILFTHCVHVVRCRGRPKTNHVDSSTVFCFLLFSVFRKGRLIGGSRLSFYTSLAVVAGSQARKSVNQSPERVPIGFFW